MKCRRSASLIVAAGEALYGARWHSALAADLGVGRVTLYRWAESGHIDSEVARKLSRLLRRRALELAAVAKLVALRA